MLDDLKLDTVTVLTLKTHVKKIFFMEIEIKTIPKLISYICNSINVYA